MKQQMNMTAEAEQKMILHRGTVINKSSFWLQ